MQVETNITINGRVYQGSVGARMLLVHFIREVAGLTGTKVGCDTSQCGSCTVQIDGTTVKSCTVLAAQADGCERSRRSKAWAATATFTRCRTHSGPSTVSSAASARRG